MPRLRFKDFRLSRGPALVGLCTEDTNRVAQICNSAELRLLNAPEAGDEGWWGTYAEIAFTVSQTAPYWTAGRNVARAQFFNVCETPVPLNNQFAEYLNFGNGRMPKTFRTCGDSILQAYTRNTVPTFVDLTTPPQYIAVYPTNPVDVGKRVLLQGTDNNSTIVYSMDGLIQVLGEYVTIDSPFALSTNQWNSLTGIQKDVTSGSVQFFQVDPTTGAQVLLLTMEPGEETANYRRYYFDRLPPSCCLFTSGGVPAATTPSNLTVTAIAALEHVPVKVDSDWLLIQNLEALIAEAQSIYYADKESAESKAQSRERHKAAISLLIGECTRYLGKDSPAVNWKPFGSADLSRVRINMT